ncbi:hypothetical protein CfE428DRAFT_5833 [Chthoniobacter flavus Ellin428]|uniref:Uncharacterized protein n=1 Tax=Chthoniobacter flavus Ellin428 TaxID=497964 RepID=B4DA93_9BACT|nr:hypothetical protein CfE428DRAFT_5833 [Chthoniobacter flavus Ellin428]
MELWKPDAGPLYYRSLAAVVSGANQRWERRRWKVACCVAGVLTFIAGFAVGALVFGGLMR